jgi:uncharacterized protein (TIGR02266 family)
MGDAARAMGSWKKSDTEASTNRAADTRRTPRAGVYVTMDVFSEHNFWTGLTLNVSEGGVFVATHHVVPPGTVVVLNMLLPYERDPIITLAEVRWIRDYSGQDDVPPGLGLRFIDTAGADLAKIRRFIATIREPLFFDD